jgi:allantoate deiminase
MGGQAIVDRCRALAALSETSGGLLRTFLSPPMREAHRLIAQWMEAAGMQVRTDAAGNLRGVYPAVLAGESVCPTSPARQSGAGASACQPRLLLGSHIDTVPNAGAFDGVLGVVMAIAMVDALGGRKLPFSIEVAAFSDEEGVRFGVPFIGSRALAGTIDAELLARRDAAGASVEDAIRAFGLDPAHLPEARLDRGTFAYIEFHIEQGPVLESLGLPLGVVTAIAGQSRLTVIFRGQANHAGTTPMHLRRDALAAAARWISLVERYARSTPSLAATVGAVEVRPGAANIVPGEVRASLDVRHADDAIRRRSTAVLLDAAKRIAAPSGIAVEWQPHSDVAATACDPCLVAALARAVAAAGFPVHKMSSGAGHDAMILAARIPVAMLFLRSPGGISHHPDETVNAADVDAALSAGAALLADLERRHA